MVELQLAMSADGIAHCLNHALYSVAWCIGRNDDRGEFAMSLLLRLSLTEDSGEGGNISAGGEPLAAVD